MKLISATLVALSLFAGAAHARPVDSVFGDLGQTAPRSAFDQISDAAPRSVFDDIRATAPRSYFDALRESAPRSVDADAAPTHDLASE